MSSAVVEKNFVWRFIDKVKQGLTQKQKSMHESQ